MIWMLALLLGLTSPAMAEDLERLLDPGTTTENRANLSLTTAVRALLPQISPAQVEYLNALGADDWDGALVLFPEAFEEFGKTANGRALFALNHFKAGLAVNGLEMLFDVAAPKDIHAEIRRAWREAAPASHQAWTLAKVKWSEGFREVFAADVEFRIAAIDANARRDLASLSQLFARLPQNNPDWGRVGWQLTVARAKAGQIEEAAKTLAQVMRANPKPVSQDLMNMTAARLLYQRGFFAAALKYYEKVPRSSEYWPDAQEEAAWAFVRKGEPANAVATSGSLMVPAMAALASPESSFVHSLGQLKVCDYAGVLTTLGEFPKRFKSRADRLKELAGDTESASVTKLIARLKKERVSLAQLGPEAQALPRLVSRDERLLEMARGAGFFEAEAKIAESAFTRTVSTTGAQGYFEQLRTRTLGRARQALADAQARVKELALQEAFEIKENLRKLHIVEAEVIQQLAISERGPAGGPKGNTGPVGPDAIKFAPDKEQWFDEIGHYRVDVKRACKNGKRG